MAGAKMTVDTTLAKQVAEGLAAQLAPMLQQARREGFLLALDYIENEIHPEAEEIYVRWLEKFIDELRWDCSRGQMDA